MLRVAGMRETRKKTRQRQPNRHGGILYPAENPVRDPGSGGAAQALILNQRLCQRIPDSVLATRAGFSLQKTEDPRSEW